MTSMTRSKTRAAALALTAVAALAFFGGACGGDDENAEDVKPASTIAATQAAAAASPAADPAAEGAATINTADAGALGSILTTVDGLTLYTFKNDVAGSGTSACEEGCTAAWPALIESEPTAGDGVTGELGTITRIDGTQQVTYNGAPLYRFVNDAKPGDTNGQGVANLWSVAQP